MLCDEARACRKPAEAERRPLYLPLRLPAYQRGAPLRMDIYATLLLLAHDTDLLFRSLGEEQDRAQSRWHNLSVDSRWRGVLHKAMRGNREER